MEKQATQQVKMEVPDKVEVPVRVGVVVGKAGAVDKGEVARGGVAWVVLRPAGRADFVFALSVGNESLTTAVCPARGGSVRSAGL
ncbi:MAG: hypothetical protein V2A71_11265 [Candidatus Eisenbacteria bacterium]